VVNEGFGRFEYQNGTIYEGQWKNFDGKKMKHGEGHLIHTANSLNEIMREEYKGSWEKDLMSGWGVYKYISGATYAGEWLDNSHHGRGTYEFPDGCIYEGEWKSHKMNGEGTFTDKNGTKWSGLFVDGVFQSKMQKRLKMEKVVTQKKQELKDTCTKFFSKFIEAYDSSDKKTLKDNMMPFFPQGNLEELKVHLREPYIKFEEKKPEQWYELVKFCQDFNTINILQKINQAKYIDPAVIITQQFYGFGQVIEFEHTTPDRISQIALCWVAENQWVLVHHSDIDSSQPTKK